jgi:hypothetical protein
VATTEERLIVTVAEAKRCCPIAGLEIEFPFTVYLLSGVLHLVHHTFTVAGVQL